MKMLRTAAAVAAIALAPALIWAAPETFKIDPVHSFVTFKVRHMNVSNAYGEFKDLKGSLVYDKDNVANSKFEVEIDANSLDTKNPKRDQHSKSPDFLNVKQFPTITYKSDSVKKLSDDEFEMTGQLTLHGVTKPLTSKLKKLGEATDPKGVHRIGGESTFTIKRSDFGMTGMMNALGDDITVTIAVEAIQEPAK